MSRTQSSSSEKIDALQSEVRKLTAQVEELHNENKEQSKVIKELHGDVRKLCLIVERTNIIKEHKPEVKKEKSTTQNIRQFVISEYLKNNAFFHDVAKIITKDEEDELIGSQELKDKLAKGKKTEEQKQKAIADFIYSKKIQGNKTVQPAIRELQGKKYPKSAEAESKTKELVADDESDAESDVE